jgi:hypothetical protein
MATATAADGPWHVLMVRCSCGVRIAVVIHAATEPLAVYLCRACRAARRAAEVAD